MLLCLDTVLFAIRRCTFSKSELLKCVQGFTFFPRHFDVVVSMTDEVWLADNVCCMLMAVSCVMMPPHVCLSLPPRLFAL